MSKSNGRQEAIRTPQQQRSQQRVVQIFEACKQLIAEKGCAALKMSDIAATADISIGSIYQYFPNKQAIVAALATHYQDAFRADAVKVLSEAPDNIDALWSTTLALLDAYYKMHREDPVVRDIWMGSATDKTLQDVSEQDRELSAQLFFELSQHLFKPSEHERLRCMLAMFVDFGQTAINRSVGMPEEEGARYFELSKELLSSCWAGSVRPIALAEKGAE